MQCRRPLTFAVLFLAAALCGAGDGTYDRGLEAFRAGEYSEAARLFAETVAEHPDWAGGHMMLGWAELREGRTASSIERLDRALEIDRENPVVRLRLAEAYATSERYADAVGLLASVDAARLARPQQAELAQLRGLAFARTDQPARAAEQYEIAIAARPGDAALHSGLGRAAAKEGDLVHAAEALERAIELDPARTDALRLLVSVYIEQALGEEDAEKEALYREAVSRARQLVEQDRESESLLLLGGAELGAKSFDAAIEAFLSAAALDPDAWQPRYYLGSAYAAIARYGSAGAALREALARAAEGEEREKTWKLLGHVFEKQQDYVEAGAAFARAGDAEAAQRVAQNAETARYNAELERQDRETAELEATAAAIEAELRALQAGELPDSD